MAAIEERTNAWTYWHANAEESTLTLRPKVDSYDETGELNKIFGELRCHLAILRNLTILQNWVPLLLLTLLVLKTGQLRRG